MGPRYRETHFTIDGTGCSRALDQHHKITTLYFSTFKIILHNALMKLVGACRHATDGFPNPIVAAAVSFKLVHLI